MQIASLEDLLSLKLATVSQRVELRDYRDIAELLRNQCDLLKGLSGTMSLYRNCAFNPYIALNAMTWFNENRIADLPLEDKKTLVESVRNIHYESLDDLSPAPILSSVLAAQFPCA
ncbi:hypothetical protein [Sutterella sp.]|uniref:hypothetical protein n=1 Tax=Sutterella sp. TaxID=1981025 RepID=UPI0026DF62B8|nr:hypothetical protein [Sutterella sp.]MDO5532909.1 hypothetical protein [Sutterella sp.]